MDNGIDPHPADFEITVSHDGVRVSLDVTGHVTAATAPALATALDALIEVGQEAVIDLSRAETLDDSGFEALSELIEDMSRLGGSLSVRAAPPTQDRASAGKPLTTSTGPASPAAM